jgi:hypothetical protein
MYIVDLNKKTHTKKPSTPPMPSICAAHAFPLACSGPERVSTMRARSTACTIDVVSS